MLPIFNLPFNPFNHLHLSCADKVQSKIFLLALDTKIIITVNIILGFAESSTIDVIVWQEGWDVMQKTKARAYYVHNIWLWVQYYRVKHVFFFY